jgi:hypothetical protein
MKTLATIGLSLVAIVASLVLVLSAVCAFYGGGLSGTSDRGTYVLCAIVSLAFVVAAMWAIAKLNRKS